MGKQRLVILLVLILLLANIILVFDNNNEINTVMGKSIYVDSAGFGNHTSIQAAINAANPGDTIYVWAGVYNESIIINKTVTIIGNGTANTTISNISFGDVVRITANSVNISGFTINGSGSNSFFAAIRLNSVINCTVSNNILMNNRYGIYLNRGSGHLILNNTCMNNYRGIYNYMANSNIIKNNTIYSNQNIGIYIYFSNENSIINNNCSNNSQSIALYYSDSNNIENNICDSNSPNDISLGSNSNFNKIANNTCNGIFLDSSGSNKIFNNTIGPTGITINGNQIEHWNQTFDLNNTMNGKALIYLFKVNNSIVPSNAGQVILIYCENITVADCNFSDIQTAIMLSYSKNTIIRNNTGSNLSEFIYLSSSDNNLIENNTYYSNNSNNIGSIILEDDSNSNVLANNTCGFVTLDHSGNNSLINNSMLTSGVSILGDELSHWIHNFDLNNTVKNEVIYYLYNINNKILPLGGGQVILINSQNITVKDQNFSNKGSGIILGFSNYNKILNNTCLNNIDPISIWNSNNNFISNNICYNTSNDGLLLSGSSYNTISNNTFNSNQFNGIRILTGSSNTIADNICNLNQNNGLYLSQSGSNFIKNNIIKSNQLDGLYLSQGSSNTIKNNKCTINQDDGIYLSRSDANKIENNKCDLNGINGLELFNCDLNTISNGTYSSNPNHGIYISSSMSTDIIDCNCINNAGSGIYIDNCDYFTLIRNKCLNNDENGISNILTEYSNMRENNCSMNNLSGVQIDGERVGYEQIPHGGNNILEDNTCSENNKSGISLFESNNNTIKRNICSENKVNGIQNIGERNAVKWLGKENVITENICKFNHRDGIYFWNGTYCSVNDNIIFQNTQHGINFYYTMKNTILNNDISSNVNGINFYFTENCDVSNNICIDNDINLFLENSSSNIINYNNFSRSAYGIFLYLDSDSNTIFKNTISKNTNTGLMLSQACNTNRIYHNNIISNTNQADEIDSTPNFWNNNIDQGNYWSDYNGLDNGASGREAGDGIGDTDIPHLGLDYYPFLKPSGWLFPGIPELFNPGELDSDGEYNITWSEPRNTVDYILEESMDELFSSAKVIYSGTNTSFNVINSMEGTYYYRVKANNSVKFGDWSNIVNIMVNFPPQIPDNFSVTVDPAGNTLNISWEPLSEPDVTEYYLYFKHTEFGTWKFLTLNQHPLNYYIHTGLINGEAYYYRLQVNDTYGHISEFSSEIFGIPLDSLAPDIPTGLLVVDSTTDSITLKWNSSLADDVVGYYIYRSSVPAPTTWGEPINGFNLYSSTEYTDKGLEEATNYYYVVTAVDEVPNESNFSLVLAASTILGEYGPEINIPQKDFEMLEDTIDNTSINLFKWFKDRNNDKLHFECKGNIKIDVYISDETGEVVLTPEPNWNGKETLVFFAHDADNYTHDEVIITVKPVNDPPGQAQITSPKDGLKVNDSTSITFQGTCPDIDFDIPDQEVHTYSWSSNISGNLGTGQTFVTRITQPGYHLITLIVLDSGGLSSKDTINVTITKTPIPEQPDQPDENDTIEDDGDEDEDEGWFMTTMIITGILIVILILLVILALRKKPAEAEEKELAEEESEMLAEELAEEPERDDLDAELETAEAEEFQCAECGELLPVGETVCPECGAEFKPDEGTDDDVVGEPLDEDEAMDDELEKIEDDDDR